MEENQVIENVPIGFTKNARTSDHMFVLKSFIDKYINMKRGRLYAWFVDFQKAFDSVKHLCLQITLNDLSINGQFYDIINNPYIQSKINVRLGEYSTDFFDSKVEIRQGDVLSAFVLFLIYITDFPRYLTGSSGPVYISLSVMYH